MLSALSTIALIYVGFGAFLYLFQRSLIYFPVAQSDIELPSIVFDSGGERIKVWSLNVRHDRAIVYFGGNAENVAYNAPDFRRWFPHHAIYLVNYRGYGGSTGAPTETALFADAEAIFDELNQKHSNISLIGRSIGSGVACDLAARRDVAALVLVTPFDSMQRVAQRALPIYPMALFLKDRYDSLSRVSAITAPTLIVAAENDEVIPIVHARDLAAAFPPGQVVFEVVAGSSHNTISEFDAYADVLRAFLAARASGGKPSGAVH